MYLDGALPLHNSPYATYSAGELELMCTSVLFSEASRLVCARYVSQMYGPG